MDAIATAPTTLIDTLEAHSKAWSEFDTYFSDNYDHLFKRSISLEDIPFEIMVGMLLAYINQFEDLKKELDKYSLSYGNTVLQMAIHEAFAKREKQL